MPVLRLNYLLPLPNAALTRSPLTFFHAVMPSMLSRAVSNHATAARPTVQQPLKPNSSVINVQRPPQKRKFDRTMSNTGGLSTLHEHVYFDENDFEDDAAIDLTGSPPRPKDVKYPKLETVHYPSLPPLPATSQGPPPSSIPVDWSSSPMEHWRKPTPTSISIPQPQETESDDRPKKKRILPWANQSEMQVTPLSKERNGVEKYPWNKSASAVKEEQKELRKKNASKTGSVKVEVASMPPDAKKIAATHLSDEQRAVAKTVVEDGKSVFFTGSAGTGKSVLMRSIISQLRQKYRLQPDRLAVTASTGLAACVIEGTTLHSWAGIGLGKEPAPELVKKIKRNAKTKTKWLKTQVLIIDEISMVDGELFDKLEAVARHIRNNGRPFGGIQLVVTGDFFQLPPVPERNSVAKFAFDAATWNTCIEHTILLTHVFRQKDPDFANMLNEMRLGRLSLPSIRSFQKLCRPLDFHDEVEATELFPTRGEVDSANSSRMQRLSGQQMTFPAVDSGVQDEKLRDRILSNFMAPEVLTLKKGAQVMLIKNLDHQLVNGTLGKVMSFMDEATFYAYNDNKDMYHMAYRDGMSDDEDTKAARARFSAARIKSKEASSSPRLWPLVHFTFPDGTFREILCIPEEWKTESQQGEIVAKRVQVPLILAWALSIHKAQGQTLSRVKVDLGKVFERGQAYVALSRATSQDGLQVLRFDPKKVMVHPKVVQFYEKLVNFKDIHGKEAKQPMILKNGGQNDLQDDEDELYMYA